MEVKRTSAKEYARKRRFKYGAYALIVTTSIVGLFVVAYVGASRTNWRFDFTENSSFTLSEQTLSVLDQLKEPIMIRAFFRRGGDIDQVFIRRKVDDVLREYAARSRHIDYAMVDPDVGLEQTVSYGIQQDGTIVFQSANRRKDIYQSVLFNYPSLADESVPLFVGESLFTNAILSLNQEDTPSVCLLEGHGERDTTSPEADGLSQLMSVLKNENYLVESVSMGTDVDWHKRCDLLIVAGPKLGFHAVEDRRLKRYLLDGKKLILMVDPQTQPQLKETLATVGIVFEPAVIFDPDRHFVLGAHYPTAKVLQHEITDRILQLKLSPVFYLARPLSVKLPDEESFEAAKLLLTSPVAWGETQLKAQTKATPDPKEDFKGPLAMAVALVQKQGEAERPSALLYGDSNFITNGLIQVPGNKDLFLNGVAWLLGQQAQISIRPRQPDFRPLVLEPETTRWVALTTEVIYPGLILSGGLFYWWRRKRR